MTISRIIGKNICDLMDKDGTSLRKLSDSIGISHPTLKRYIDGDQPIDSEKLMMIAKYFGKSFDYFFSDSKNDFNFMFRADSPESKIIESDLEEYKQTLLNYIDIVNDSKINFIPQSYSLRFSGKSLKKDEEELIEKIAFENRRIFNIEAVIPENYYDIVEKAGINLIVKKFSNLSFFGASSYSSEYGSFILINDSDEISEERKIFSLFHEYAHLIFDREQYIKYGSASFYTDGKNKLNEKIADVFAARFLMPRNMVDEYIKERKDVNLIEMKKYFKVSLQTLYRTLYEYDHISRDIYKKFWEDLFVNDLRKVEPYPLNRISIEDKNIRLINSIKELFEKEDISLNKVSVTLGLENQESRELIRKWREANGRYLLMP